MDFGNGRFTATVANTGDVVHTMFDLVPIAAKCLRKNPDVPFRYDKSHLNEECLNTTALAALEDTLPDLGITSR